MPCAAVQISTKMLAVRWLTVHDNGLVAGDEDLRAGPGQRNDRRQRHDGDGGRRVGCGHDRLFGIDQDDVECDQVDARS